MSERIIIPLKYPIPVPVKKEDGSEGVQTIDKLTLERPKIKHLKLLPEEVFKEGDSASPILFLPMIAGLAGIPEASVDEIDLEDLQVIGGKIAGFLPQLQETGEKQS